MSDSHTEKAYSDPWEGWDATWAPVREAMARRGFFRPPNGPVDTDGTQRDRLWQLVRENSTLVARLINSAPPDFTSGSRPFYDLVGYVFRNWNAAAETRS